MSRTRPTTDPHVCFVTARLTILRKRISPALAPAHFPTPSTRLGPRLLRRSHRSRAEGGTGRRNKTPISSRGQREGDRDRVRMSSPPTPPPRPPTPRPITHPVPRQLASN